MMLILVGIRKFRPTTFKYKRMKNKFLTKTVEDKQSWLYSRCLLLDFKGIFYFDDDAIEIDLLENHLNKLEIPYHKGKVNRNFISLKQ